MSSAFVVALLWVLFGGTHLGLAALHDRLAARFGVLPFTLGYSALASVTFTALVVYFALHRADPPAGLGLATFPAARWALEAGVGFGVVVAVAGLTAYPRLPTALFEQPLRQPRGVERITRHPMFVGFGIIGAGHALLATHLIATVWFAGFAAFAAVGAWHQDRRALATRGAAYAEYLAATSVVPFARGLPRLAELPYGALAAGVVVAVALRLAHSHLWDCDGAWVAGVVVIGGFVAGAQARRRKMR